MSTFDAAMGHNTGELNRPVIPPMPVHSENTLDCLLTTVHAHWRTGSINDAVYAACFFLGWQVVTHGERFASRRSRHDKRPEATHLEAAIRANALPAPALADLLERYQYLGVTPHAITALAAWMRGRWPLVLHEEVPEALSLLAYQAAGTRVVTVIIDPVRRHLPIMHKPDAFAFLIHDLEHAYQFFHHPNLHQQQRAFYISLQRWVQQGWFDGCRSDPAFNDKFNYLMSDMNTHPAHSVSYLRAIVIEHFLSIEGKPAAAPLAINHQATVERLLAPFADFCPGYPDETHHAVATARA